MQRTTNYLFKKPEANDFINIDDLNYNADAIDQLLKTHDTKINDITPEKITDTSSTTKTIALLKNNQIYELGTLTNLTVTAADTALKDAYISFKSGSSITVSLPTGFKISGSEVVSNVFYPVPNKYYELSFRKNNGVIFLLILGVI